MEADAKRFMRAALAEAGKAVGRTHPNPAVGSVIVKNGRVIARGHTAGRPGSPHAEVVALEVAGEAARGADLYTTLEPCDHFGRTPPCSRAILAAGIKRVFAGCTDPNPKVHGKGVKRLRRGGVTVVNDVLREEAERVNLPFFKHIRTGLPYVTLKAAVTLDGKLAGADGSSRWVTGEAARARVHALRNQVDAILVGANTVRLDDPSLTTRLVRGAGQDATRVVLDSRLSLSPRHRVFHLRSAAPTIVVTSPKAPRAAEERLLKTGAQVWRLPAARGEVRLLPLLKRLAAEGHLHLLVEGGAAVFASFLKAGLVDELWLFVAPKVLGEEGRSWVGPLGRETLGKAVQGSLSSVESLGEDVLMRVRFPVRPRSP